MNIAHSLFLELLTAAIWNRPANSERFQHIDTAVWEKIIELSIAQKVNALIYDGVMSLPQAFHPEKKIIYKLHLQAETIEASNRSINNVLKKLSAEYKQLACPFVLLKGQANAMLYPNPLHRTPGDIDVYLYQKGDYEKTNNWAREQGFKMDAENIHHQSFEYEGIHIENHKNITYFGIVKYDRLLEKKIQEIITNSDFISVHIDELPVRVLPIEFNAFFIFQHLFHHFIHLGVGIRQFCDWVLFFDTYSTQINKERFNSLVADFGLLNAMQVFASVAVKYMGTKASIFPFSTDTQGKYVDLVMHDIFRGGSFGYSVFQNKRFRNSLHRKWHSFACTISRLQKIYGIAPRHTITLPLNKVVTNIKLLFKK
ncbi:MAG: nucleotidyltransferase family protein [Bacteroidia bacterium]|nr:nucleotidyltransferase family protein [Bacteroidia bacterium]